ncbi:YsaB family lipoprotein [Enterobacter mori]|uniref:YsaB family lipoprotein n=1 Tax=Enterobacter mori TaxID=539813 RepID=UPI0021B145DE|nr:YsaB family lipoprotein [Enterobacter mori]UWX93176.1 YsaB family lipoprotein [Enterobacter mori]
MMMKRVAALFLLLILAGCSTSQDVPEQKAQQGKISPERSLNMEQLCKDQAAHRYNSEVQKITVNGFERFQRSYELKGYTARKEGFVCSFDADGQFLHLSMR